MAKNSHKRVANLTLDNSDIPSYCYYFGLFSGEDERPA